MSDTASGSQPPNPSSIVGATSSARGEADLAPAAMHGATDDQPTVISRRPPTGDGSPIASGSADLELADGLKAGDVLGHFEIVEFVGGGGMGRVYRAIDRRLGRSVAVKVLSAEQAATEETLSRFRNEAQSAARLDHDNVARVYYIGEDRGLHFIVFEFIQGHNIRNLVERHGPLSLPEAVSYSLQVAEALVHIAGHDVVHRDVKPSNVLVTPEGHVKLIDMGLARLRRLANEEAELTASGVTLGTFDYISPEQARDPRVADARSDVYSLGCTLFYMLTGRPPFPEGTVLQKLLQHQGDEPPDVRGFRPELPDEANRVLRKMLAKDPRHRYGHPAELVEDLMALAYQVGLRPAGSRGRILVAPRQPKIPTLYRHLPWVAPVAVLVCIVALIGYFSEPLPGEGEIVQRPPLEDPLRGLSTPGNNANEIPGMSANENDGTPSGAVLPDETTQSPGGLSNGQEGVHNPQDGGADLPPRPRNSGGSGSPLPMTGHGATGDERDSASSASEHSLDTFEDVGLEAAPLRAGLSLAMDAELVEALGSKNALSLAGALSGGLSGSVLEDSQPYSATEASVETASVRPLPEATPAQTGLLVVTSEPSRSNEYSSLGAACDKATDGDIIELRYDGAIEEPRPIKLTDVKLTIQAGKGYRPVVAFRPDEEAMDPLRYPHAMFTLTAGQMELAGVSLELDVPLDVPADSWSLIETHGTQTVRLDQTVLTIRNAAMESLDSYHPEVAFFRCLPSPEVGMRLLDDVASETLATIELHDCVARGEAAFLATEDSQAVHLEWDNGLLVISDQLLRATGGGTLPAPADAITIEIRHLTAITRGGLCLLTDRPSTPHQLPVHFECARSILASASEAPLIQQVGGNTLDALEEQVRWTGDRNSYKDFDIFWEIRDRNYELLAEPRAFDEWELYWQKMENRPSTYRGEWRVPMSWSHPLHTHDPSNYVIDGPVGSDAGCLMEALPAPTALDRENPPIPDAGRSNPPWREEAR